MFTYVPAPHERSYYGALFQAADVDRSGTISSIQAVTFLTRSKLPIPILKELWTLSDEPLSNTLDARKFAVAVRLVQLAQHGLPFPAPGTDLAHVATAELVRPAWFEGMAPPPTPPVGPLQTQPTPQSRGPPMGASVAGGASVSGGASVASQGPPPRPQTQLVTQDPYLLTPADQYRYDQMFPEYASPSDPNFLYGAQAVALLEKSGLPRDALSHIWTMVDCDPVDNRLDKLEFAMAMHLVICVSIKRLPLPASLPLSLEQWKRGERSKQMVPPPNGTRGPESTPDVAQPPPMQQQQQPPMQQHAPQSMSQPPPMQQHAPQSMSQQQHAPPTPVTTSVTQGGFGVVPPQISKSGIPSPMPTMGATLSMDGAGPSLSGLPGPPPLTQQVGGLSISDAFEGLGTAGDTGSISSYGAASTPMYAAPSNGFAMPAYNHNQESEPVTVPDNEPAPLPPSQAVPPPMTTQQLASSYDMGETNEELVKLRSALQKLQAENISLKAKMGTMNDDERDVQKELNATIAEVSNLANELTKTRAQVLASKSRLLESTAELKAAKEKKGVLKDLIDDATATKQAIDEAYESIETANEEVRHAPSVQPQLQAAPPGQETDFFGGWGDDNAVQPPLPISDTYDSLDSVDNSVPMGNAGSMAQPPQMNSMQPSPYMYNAGPAPEVPPSSDTYGGGYAVERGVLNREASEGFGEVMGGGPTPLLQQPSGFASGTTSMSGASTFDSIPVAVSMKEVEDLQSKSKEADDVAKEAEASRQQLTAQLEELRKVADDAENKARAAADKPAKKKGLLKRGGVPKKDAKELEKLAMDARDKKEKMLLVQSQVKDAESVATATKQEAERLNKAAEEAQMAAAAAASMQDQSRAAPPPDNGYAQKAPPQPSYGMAPTPPMPNQPMYGMPGNVPPLQDGSFGGPPLGYDSHVMGSGGAGLSIPTPSAMDDPYSNPFE